MRILPLALVVLFGCAATKQVSTAEVRKVQSWMTGTFDSFEQSAEDPENFFPIRLVMVPIWEDRDDGPWLYVEQAAKAQLDKPYRQRVYRLAAETRGGVRSEVYTLPGKPLDHAGQWKLEGVQRGQIKFREGCTIYLTRENSDRYIGGTRGKGCKSSLGDAAYTTSEVVVEPELLTSWDRGWTKDDKQAWGATKGPYRFVKKSSTHP